MARKVFKFYGHDGIKVLAKNQTEARKEADKVTERIFTHAARNRTRIFPSVTNPGYVAVMEPMGEDGYWTYFVTPQGEVRAFCSGSYGKKANDVWSQHLAWFAEWLKQESLPVLNEVLGT